MAHPQIITVIERLGVSLGVGDLSIGAICMKMHIDTDFFLSVVNTFVDHNYFPRNPNDYFTLHRTVQYLERTGHYYRQALLPNIDRHFMRLVEVSGSDNNLQMLNRFYLELRTQFNMCIDNDENVVYPGLLEGKSAMSPEAFESSHLEVEERLHDLLYFFVAHLRGEYDHNLCMAVVSAVFALHHDYQQNNRIRRRILLPIMRTMA